MASHAQVKPGCRTSRTLQSSPVISASERPGRDWNRSPCKQPCPKSTPLPSICNRLHIFLRQLITCMFLN